MKDKELKFYMQTAEHAAEMSHAVRKKVGACVITKNRGIYIGYNGRLAGQDNCCEYQSLSFKSEFGKQTEVTWKLVTRKDVAHAELNCLSKMLKEGVSAEDATLVLTLSPCATCAVMIASAGIKEVIYKEEYRDIEGLKILMEAGVSIRQYNEN